MSLRQHALNAILRTAVKPSLRGAATPQQARRSFHLVSRAAFRMPPYALQLPESFETSSGSISALWISCKAKKNRNVLLYLHGGGFVLGSPKTHASLLARLSHLSGFPVFSPDYRLAPESPFPAQLEDAKGAWNSLIARGYNPDQIVIGGDSAGGGLALSLLSWLCQSNAPPAGCFVFSPWTDLTLSGASLVENARSDVLLPVARTKELRAHFLQGSDPEDPRASPLFARFPQCPPVFFQASQSEILRDDTLRMADVLRQQGAQVTLDLWDALPHVWQLFQGWLPEADQALENVATFMNELFPYPPPTGN